MNSIFNELATGKFPIDVIETNDAYAFEVDVPGLTNEDIEVLIDHESVELKINARDDGEDLKYLHRERPVGEFSRKLNFGKPLDPQGASSKLENGILRVVVPIAPEAKKVSLAIN